MSGQASLGSRFSSRAAQRRRHAETVTTSLVTGLSLTCLTSVATVTAGYVQGAKDAPVVDGWTGLYFALGIGGALMQTETQKRIATGHRAGEASDHAYWSIATIMRSDRAALSTVRDALGLGGSTVDVAYTAIQRPARRQIKLARKVLRL